jgi:tetratricopeptide (TPR) repeat protein
MSTAVITSSARGGFVLGLSVGLGLATAFFLIRPDLSVSTQEAASAPVPAAPSASMSSSTSPGTAGAGSMESATLALKTRLATQGGPDDQWELLAQSYDFLGRDEDAMFARQHRPAPDSDLRDAVAASAMLLSGPLTQAAAAPALPVSRTQAEALIASAEQHRTKREFKEACANYAEVAKLGAMTADTWADYADAQASMAGRLAGEPEKALAKALALDPQHTKALWLKASLAHEQHRYQDAVRTWRQLLGLVPPGSSDARIVEANMAEATRLANG